MKRQAADRVAGTTTGARLRSRACDQRPPDVRGRRCSRPLELHAERPADKSPRPATDPNCECPSRAAMRGDRGAAAGAVLVRIRDATRLGRVGGRRTAARTARDRHRLPGLEASLYGVLTTNRITSAIGERPFRRCRAVHDSPPPSSTNSAPGPRCPRHRALGEAHQGRPRVQGLLPVPPGEDAELHGQRREGLLPLLRLRRAWRRDPLSDRRPRLPFMDAVKGSPARPGWRFPPPTPRPGTGRARRRPDDVMEAAQRWFVEHAGVEGGAARDYLAGARDRRRDVERFGFGLAPDAPQPPQGALPAMARTSWSRPAC